MKYYYDTEFLEGIQKRPLILKGRRGNWMIGLPKPTIDLISIGIVSEDSREYYAISKEFNLKEAWNRFDVKITNYIDSKSKKSTHWREQRIYWIRENVLMPIFYELALKDFHLTHFNDEWFVDGKKVTLEVFKESPIWRNDLKWFKELLQKYGKTNKQIAEEVKYFLCEKSTMLPSGKMSPIEILGSDKSPIELYGYYSAYDHVVFCWLFGKMIDLPKGFPMYTKDLKQLFDEKASSFTRSDFFTAVDFLDKGLPELSLEEKINHFKMHVRYPIQENEHNALADARWNKKLHEFINSI